LGAFGITLAIGNTALTTRVSAATLETLYSFCAEGVAQNFPGGGFPNAVIMDTSGNLCGTTGEGGTRGNGTVFRLSNAAGGWVQTPLYSFCPQATAPTPDGAAPEALCKLRRGQKRVSRVSDDAPVKRDEVAGLIRPVASRPPAELFRNFSLANCGTDKEISKTFQFLRPHVVCLSIVKTIADISSLFGRSGFGPTTDSAVLPGNY
jgi:hypothetical protein